MGNCPKILTTLLVAAVLSACAGCASPAPTLVILSPQNGAAVPAGNVTVTVQAGNFQITEKQGQANVPGEGLVHYYMDVGTVPSTPGQPAIPSDAAAQWAHVADTSSIFTNVSPGTHTFTVQLVNNDHTPVIPLVYQSVTVTVAAPPGPSVTILSPQDSADIPAGDMTVTIQANNFNIVEKQGQANVAGEGHVHYYLDIGTVPFMPEKPAIPSDPNVPWAHVAATSYTFRNVLPGMHTISVQLVNNDHTPVVPLVYQSIMVIATGQTVIPATTVPATMTPPGAGKTV